MMTEEGGKPIDFICKFESLQEDFERVCEYTNLPALKLGHHNKSPTKKHYSHYYNDQMIQVVAKKYAKDIEYFGYEFGE